MEGWSWGMFCEWNEEFYGCFDYKSLWKGDKILIKVLIDVLFGCGKFFGEYFIFSE